MENVTLSEEALQAAAEAAAATAAAAVTAQGGSFEAAQIAAAQAAQAALNPESIAQIGQMSALLQQTPVINPVQAQLLANPELAAKMMGPIGANGPAAAGDPSSSCTIYVGNINPSITADQLSQFFAAVCGEVLHCRLAGDDAASAYRFDRSRFAFVQFKSKEQADLAMTLSGTVLGNLPIKCGPARNPIVQVKPTVPAQTTIDNDAMAKLKAAQERILNKVGAAKPSTPTAAAQAPHNPPAVVVPPESLRGRSRSPPRRRSRSRERRSRSPRRRRSRSRSRDRRRSRSRDRRDRDRDRDRDRRRRSSSRERRRDRDRGKDKDKEKDRDRDKEKERGRDKDREPEPEPQETSEGKDSGTGGEVNGAAGGEAGKEQ